MFHLSLERFIQQVPSWVFSGTVKRNAKCKNNNNIIIINTVVVLRNHFSCSDISCSVKRKGSLPQLDLHRLDVPGSHQGLTFVGTLAICSLLRSKLSLNENSSVFKLQGA